MGDDCDSYCVEKPPEREENGEVPGWKKATKKGRSNELLQPFRVSLFERHHARLISNAIKRCYFTREAISSAKFSCFFSMPSPFSNRTAVLKVIAPPSSLAAWAI